MTTIQQPIFHLPHEVQVDIFSRLSLQDLSQCKFVSKAWYKSWCRLVHHPFFITSQHSRTNPDDESDSLVIFATHNGVSNLYYVNHDGDNLNTSLKALKISLGLDISRTNFAIVGSSNGLVCLASLPGYNSFYVCNPLTGEVSLVPRSRIINTVRKKDICSSCGFAFDPSSNKYKVVYVFAHHHEFHGDNDDHGNLIYTSGSYEWRKITNPFPLLLENKSSLMVLVKGGLHWLGRFQIDSNGDQECGIVVLDVASESFNVFGEIAFSKNLKEKTLGVLGGCLCLCGTQLTYFDASNINEIWVMKNYGVQSSWSLQYSIKNHTICAFPQGGYLKIIKIMKNRIIMLQFGKRQGYYKYEKLEYGEKHNYIEVAFGGVMADKMEIVSHVTNLASPWKF